MIGVRSIGQEALSEIASFCKVEPSVDLTNMTDFIGGREISGFSRRTPAEGWP